MPHSSLFVVDTRTLCSPAFATVIQRRDLCQKGMLDSLGMFRQLVSVEGEHTA